MSGADTTTFTIKSAILHQERKITLVLPRYYDTDTDQRFSVTYVLDGNSKQVLNLISSSFNYLSDYAGATPGCITVGIHQLQRREELSETDYGDKFLAFITEELIPYVDSHFRTTSSRTFLGHSNGGRFVLYALLKKSGSFTNYIAFSPSFTAAKEAFYRNGLDELFLSMQSSKKLYIAIGNTGENEGAYLKSLDRIAEVLERKKHDSLHVLIERMDGITHDASPAFGIPHAVLFIFEKLKNVY